MLSISTTLSGVISHARLFVTGQLRNPWQTLAEPLGSAEPRLKNTAIVIHVKLFHDFACQKLSELAIVSRSYSKNKSGTVFFETWCTDVLDAMCDMLTWHDV